MSKRIIGLMSGTSLDGLDVCCADFKYDKGDYSYSIVNAKTFKYSQKWIEKLRLAIKMSSSEIDVLQRDFAILMTDFVKEFISEYNLKGTIDFIASHGHTVFHDPKNKITVQVGEGQLMADLLSLKIINDFRIDDVLNGGQGAPLVPIGDRLLFSRYQACLNLGGISNISLDVGNERIAFDIGPANIPLNYLMKEKLNLNYDKGGAIAKKGTLIVSMFHELNSLTYYEMPYPKSLGVEWIDSNVFPILKKYENESLEDILNTIVRHETHQIIKCCQKLNISKVLVTGGGAFNSFFMELLSEAQEIDFIIAEEQVVDFKEALIFGFLGFLRDRNENNILSSVTGAAKDSCGGKIHIPSAESRS